MLTDEQKQQGRELGLSMDEMRLAVATRISLARYAYHKAAIVAEREAVLDHESQFNDQLVKRAQEWVAGGPVYRGERLPDPEESE